MKIQNELNEMQNAEYTRSGGKIGIQNPEVQDRRTEALDRQTEAEDRRTKAEDRDF